MFNQLMYKNEQRMSHEERVSLLAALVEWRRKFPASQFKDPAKIAEVVYAPIAAQEGV